MILVPVSPGELLDKITILAIKLRRIKDPAKLANIELEYNLLDDIRSESLPDVPGLALHFERLAAVNEALWDVEDDLRNEEAAQQFGERFVSLARSVYVLNDERADEKKAINLLLGSAIVEEKSYADYRSGAKSALVLP